MRKWLYKMRKAKNFTMLEVAEQSGISESYYSLIENGHRSVPVNTAKRIAKTLNFDWSKFYEEDKK